MTRSIRVTRLHRFAFMTLVPLSLAACGGGHTPPPSSAPPVVRALDAGVAQRSAADDEAARAELAARDLAAAERIVAAREQQAALLEAARDQAAQQAAAAARTREAVSVEASARLGEVVTQIEMRVREIDAALAILATLRAGTVDARVVSAPPVCDDREVLERARIISSSGSQVTWDATGLVGSIDDLCARMQRWRTPDERSRPAIANYFQKIRHIEGWMGEIRACVGASGRDAARCENAYGRTQDAEAAEARVIEALLVAHRGELDGVENGARPFPCTTPTLARIQEMTFTGSVARAQMTGLPRDAEQVCAAIGVSERELREAHRSLRTRLDQSESTLRSQRRAQQNQLELIRAQLGE
jgi:hypothetical protein